MYTLEEINEAAKAKGWKFFQIWTLLWVIVILGIIVFGAIKNPDLKVIEIVLMQLPFFILVMFSSCIFYALAYYETKKKMKEENEHEEKSNRDDHYKRMEELLEKMSNKQNK